MSTARAHDGPARGVIERIAVLAPRGRDAEVVRQVLARSGIEGVVCGDVAALLVALVAGIDAVLATEEAVAGEQLSDLLAWIDAQPPWSDVPVIMLATQQTGRRSSKAAQLVVALGDVVMLERPINVETLTSAARSALRARRRQYQARDLLADQARRERDLERLNATLEQRVEDRTRELDGARETLAFALDSAGMGIWDLDLRTDELRRSPQHDRIFGYASPPTDWSLDLFLKHVVDDDRAPVQTAFEAGMETGALDFECRVRGADDVVRSIATKGRVSRDAGGRLARMAGVVIDVTEPRRVEDALRQSQKMEAIGQLTGGVAHDFNNFLTVVIGGLDMIVRRPEPTERVVRMAQAALTAARRGEQLTQQLLAFSRRQVLRPQTFDPNRLLLDFEVLARRAVGESVEIALDLDPDAYAIRADPAQFESAVLNLLVNARDALPNGGRIAVRSRNLVRLDGDVPAGEVLSLEVVDDGEGMEAAVLARVFEPFFTTKEVGRGSGLGLSQVYGFTRSAGGGVEIVSVRGEGTTVRLLFPRSLDRDDRREGERPQEPIGAASGETVLLVDDDDAVREMALESLRELKYQVICARNAREALDVLADNGRIDILFTDVVMPGGMHGAQLAEEARRLRPALRVLLTSGYIGSNGHGDGDDAVPVLDKPYRREDLARKLRQVLADQPN